MSERSDAEPGMLRKVAVAGTGAVASALVAELRAAGLEVLLWGRDGDAAERLARVTGAVPVDQAALLCAAEVVVLAVSDGAAGDVAAVLGEGSSPLLHTGGPQSGVEALGGASRDLGSLHPLVAVPRQARDGVACGRFRGMPFAIESSGTLGLTRARQLVDALGAVTISVDAPSKLRYHALATMVATGVVALVDRAAHALRACGEAPEAERQAYALLARSAARNLERLDGPTALTGALARGDEGLIERHRASLQASDSARDLYDAVTRAAREMLEDEEAS